MNRKTVCEPYADTLLKALSGAIRSKNPVIRKSFATATGYVCQLATFDRLCSLVRHLKKLYVEETDEDAQAASAVTAVDMTRFATDRMKAVASELVPLLFLGEHDPEESISSLYKDAWENLTSGKPYVDGLWLGLIFGLSIGTRSMVTLHMDEIISFVQPLLSSPSWRTKQTAALTIADICKTGDQGIRNHVDKLIPVMVSTLATRSWSGKEHVLAAFVQLCKTAQDYFQEPTHEPRLEEVVKVREKKKVLTCFKLRYLQKKQILVREAKRKNKTYQRHALVSLYDFAEAFAERVDMFESVQGFLTDLCTMDEAEAMEDEENDNAKPLILMIKANAFKALAVSFRPRVFPDQGM